MIMRIGVDGIPFAFEFTGIARYVFSMLKEMVAVAKSDEFIIYAPVPIDLNLPGNNWCIRAIPSWLSSRPTLWSQFVLPEMLAKDKIDIFWGQPTYLPLRVKNKCRRVLTLHDLVPYVCPASMQFRALVRMRLLLKQVVNAADVVICVSNATAEMAKKILQLDAGKVRVVKEAAAESFQPKEKNEARKVVREKFQIDSDYIIFVSTIEPRKEHLTLLRAINQLAKPPLLVLVGGKGWRYQQIMKEISHFEKAGKVRFLGRVGDTDLCYLYSAALIAVYPSRYEGFGLPVLEAMACGCPVLCSDSSSLPEIGGDAAVYFRTGDFRDLAGRIKEVLGDNYRLKQMAEAGREWVKQFSFRQSAEEMMAIIKEGSRY